MIFGYEHGSRKDGRMMDNCRLFGAVVLLMAALLTIVTVDKYGKIRET